MPKLGMGPIRRAQIFRAATEVIAKESFSGTTLKKVADAAGVSTGTVNHYFARTSRPCSSRRSATSQRSGTTDTRKAVYGVRARPAEAQEHSSKPPGRELHQPAPVEGLDGRVGRGTAVSRAARRAAAKPEEWTGILAERLELINDELGGAEIDARDISRQYDALQNGSSSS